MERKEENERGKNWGTTPRVLPHHPFIAAFVSRGGWGNGGRGARYFRKYVDYGFAARCVLWGPARARSAVSLFSHTPSAPLYRRRWKTSPVLPDRVSCVFFCQGLFIDSCGAPHSLGYRFQHLHPPTHLPPNGNPLENRFVKNIANSFRTPDVGNVFYAAAF